MDFHENGLPLLDAIAITFIKDKQTAFLEFIKGNLDFISGLDASYKDELLTPQGNYKKLYRKNSNSDLTISQYRIFRLFDG